MRSICVLTLSGGDAINFDVMRAFANLQGQFASREEGDAEFLRILLANFAGDIATYEKLSGQKYESPEDLTALREILCRHASASQTQPDLAISG